MTIPRFLPAIAALLALTVTSTAEPESPRHADPPAELRIEHMENAAKHLAEAGMTDESTRLRVQAAALRRDMHHDEFAELDAMIEVLRNENRVLHQRIEQLEAEARARVAKPRTQSPADLDQLAAEAHRKQTEATWAAIKRAARGPLPATPPDQALPLTPPQLLPPAIDRKKPAPRSDHALLEDILQTLLRIEEKLAD